MAYKRNSGIPMDEGGTGNTTMTAYAVVCGGTTPTGALQSVSGLGSAGQILTSNGAAALPTFQAAPASGIGTLNGDSGSATGATVDIKGNAALGAGKTLLFSGSGSTLNLSSSDGNSNMAIGYDSGSQLSSGIRNTAYGVSSLANLTTVNYNTAIGYAALNSDVSGASNTALGYGALYQVVSGSSNIAIGINAGSNYTGAESSNILIGVAGTNGESGVTRIGGSQTACYIDGIDGVNVGSVATVVTESGDKLGTATITAGSGISVTPGANTITIASTATGLIWSEVTVDASFTVNTGTIANKAGLLTMTLPATAALGDIIEITNINTAVGWRIAQNANQYIRAESTLTTTGVGGYLEATALGDSVKLVCIVAGASTGWQALSMVGNLTIV
jgi:hypothetical protein